MRHYLTVKYNEKDEAKKVARDNGTAIRWDAAKKKMDIEIYIDGIYATHGTIINGEIECPGALGDSSEETEEIYEAIEDDVLSSEYLEGVLIISGKEIKWEIEEEK